MPCGGADTAPEGRHEACPYDIARRGTARYAARDASIMARVRGTCSVTLVPRLGFLTMRN